MKRLRHLLGLLVLLSATAAAQDDRISMYLEEGKSGAVWDVAISPDGRIVYSCGRDSTIKMWNTLNGECLRTMRAARATLNTALALSALRPALQARHVAPGLVHHSDRGSPYASDAYQRVLREHGLVASMSRKGDCWDNAVAESFFSTLEFEGPSTATWRTAQDAGAALFAFIESYYNARRLHSRNGYRSPNETESDWRSHALSA